MSNLEAKFKKVEDAWYEAEGKISTLKHEKRILLKALKWYAETVEGCRKIGPAGDTYRHALDRDGGETARVALEEVI